MKKLKCLIKKIIAQIINLILPVISKFKINADMEKAKKEIYKFEKITKIYDEENFEKSVSLDDNVDLSIIIPAYNAENTIEMCLDSIVNQKTSYQFEIIIVNDGSTDKTEQILENYKRKFDNIVIIEQENGGAGKARNKGISYAKRKIHRIY